MTQSLWQDDPSRPRLLEIHRRLCGEYGCPHPYFHTYDPVSELVSSLLSHRTRNAESSRAFKALKARYGGDWALVAAAPTAEVEACIAGVTWPEQKAPRIQEVLRGIRERTGGLSLDFLAEMTPEAARAWLRQLPGIGPKTSAAVLAFSSLRMKALPVDSHHHRVAVRLGLIPAKLAVGPAHDVLAAQLPAEWGAQELYDNHEVLMLHGQRVCFFQSPACRRCVLLDLCPTGQARMGGGEAAIAASAGVDGMAAPSAAGGRRRKAPA
ncbi:MAG TPA: Fe-S cluster assembly protein HesB [Alphaproteobacteria bacterium]|nr:Fe-S cluster assembly protein HesB [Alphaproteobacteria bacterium]